MNQLNILVIDFFDSFTYNLVQALSEMNHDVLLKSYCQIIDKREDLLKADIVVLGPGPGHVQDYSEFVELIEEIKTKQVFLGVCLGHQILGHLNGYSIERLPRPIHGLSLNILNSFKYLSGKSSIPHDVKAMYYNSWSLKLAPTACGHSVVDNNQISLIDFDYGLGIQFHPESVGTSCPKLILDAALKRVYNKKNEDSTSNYWSLRPENYSASQRKQDI